MKIIPTVPFPIPKKGNRVLTALLVLALAGATAFVAYKYNEDKFFKPKGKK